jgi:hypothetical protein
MDHFSSDQKILESISSRLKEKNINLSIEDLPTVVDQIKDEILYWHVKRLINRVETILEIDPSPPENEILQTLAKNVQEYLGAEFASIWLYDPDGEEMVSFGSHPSLLEDHRKAIPLEDTIAAEVVKTHQSYLVSNFFKEEKCRNREKAEKLGIHSMMMSCPSWKWSVPPYNKAMKRREHHGQASEALHPG